MELFLMAAWVGIVFCAPPGAIAAEAIRRGVTRGFWPALLVEFGSLVGDATWATIALVGLAVLVQNPLLRLALALIGAALLFYLARSALQDARTASARPSWVAFAVDLAWGVVAVTGLVWLIQGLPDALAAGGAWLRWPLGLALFLLGWWRISAADQQAMPKAQAASAGGDFATGAFLSLGNPWNIVFWVGLGSSQLAALENPQIADYVTFFAGFMTGAVIWCFIIAGLIGFGRQWITPSFFRRINLVCGLLLGFFALQLLVQPVSG
jgi:chemosensory pili system protein ChpE